MILIAANVFQNRSLIVVDHHQTILAILNRVNIKGTLRVRLRKMALQPVSRSLERVWVILITEMSRRNRGQIISMRQVEMLIMESNEPLISQQASTLMDLNANHKVLILFSNLCQRAKTVANRES